MGDFGDRYVRKETVEARFLEEPETIVTRNGTVAAQAGQYVIKRDDGLVVMEQEEFEENYDEDNSPDPVVKSGDNITVNKDSSPSKDSAARSADKSAVKPK